MNTFISSVFNVTSYVVILNAIRQWKHCWMGHVLRHDIIERRIKGKPTRGRRRLQVLDDLTEGDGYAALMRAAEE